MGLDTSAIAKVARPAKLGGIISRQIFLILALCGALIYFQDIIQGIDIKAVFLRVPDITLSQWLLALIATGCSFLAIASYDRHVHAMLQTGTPPTEAMKSGACAVAIGQFVGFGVLTSSLVRWRLLPNQSFTSAFRISGIVAVSFIVGWGVVLSILVLVTRETTIIPDAVVYAIILCAAVYPLGHFLLRNWPTWMPPTITVVRLTAAVFLDLFFAALAYYALMPVEQGLDFPVFLTIFVFATMIGLFCGTPGGLGAFELALLTGLGHVPAEILLSTAFAFRIVYHAIPATIAMAYMGCRELRTDPTGEPYSRAGLLPTDKGQSKGLADLSPEAGLARQNGFGILRRKRRPVGTTALLPNSLALMHFDDTLDRVGETLTAFQASAHEMARSPIVYKCGPRAAAKARNLGWQIAKVAQEAIVFPQSYDHEKPAYRQLRRKLRKAEKAGVRVNEIDPLKSQHEMRAIATAWAKRNGGERGFSMGRYCPTYVDEQRVFAAFVDDTMIGFVSFHCSSDMWVLDLMRSADVIPDGTMHMLIDVAIRQAKLEKISKFSLAAAPARSPDLHPTIQHLANQVDKRNGAAGLRQFKESFNPHWAPRYMAAPTRLGLFIGGSELFMKIHRPPEMHRNDISDRKVIQITANNLKVAHNHYAEYEIAST